MKVPGIGKEAIKSLAKKDDTEGVTNTYHLIGKFMALHPDEV